MAEKALELMIMLLAGANLIWRDTLVGINSCRVTSLIQQGVDLP